MSSRNFTISSMLDDKDAQGAASAAPAEVVGSRSRSPTPGVRAQFQVQAPSLSQSTSQRSILGEDVVIVDDDGSGPGLGPPRRRPRVRRRRASPSPLCIRLSPCSNARPRMGACVFWRPRAFDGKPSTPRHVTRSIRKSGDWCGCLGRRANRAKHRCNTRH